MLLKILLAALCLYGLQPAAVAQSKDSTYIRQFLDSTAFPAVDTVYYHKEYGRDRLEEESWLIVETVGPGSRILSRNSRIEEEQLTFYIGVRYVYYNNGAIQRIDTLDFDNGMNLCNYYTYRRSGTLKRVERMNYSFTAVYGDTPDPDKSDCNNPYRLEGSITEFVYDRQGHLKEKITWINGSITDWRKY